MGSFSVFQSVRTGLDFQILVVVVNVVVVVVEEVVVVVEEVVVVVEEVVAVVEEVVVARVMVSGSSGGSGLCVTICDQGCGCATKKCS